MTAPNADGTPLTDKLFAGIEARRKLRSFHVPEDVRDAQELCADLERALTALRERLAAAERDAERYRWIAENYDAFMDIQKDGNIGVEIEVAIDAAREKEGE